jgi:hypothetical protein
MATTAVTYMPPAPSVKEQLQIAAFIMIGHLQGHLGMQRRILDTLDRMRRFGATSDDWMDVLSMNDAFFERERLFWAGWDSKQGPGRALAIIAGTQKPRRRYTARAPMEGGLKIRQISAESGFGESTLRAEFRDEPSVRVIVHKAAKRGKGRGYKSLRIPRAVVDRVLARLTQ